MLLVVKCEGCGKTISSRAASSDVDKARLLAEAGRGSWNVTPEGVVKWDVCDQCYEVETMVETTIY